MTEPIALVTGASGFIGSHLTEALLAQGYRVRCMVRRSSDLRYIADLPVELSFADLEDAAGLRQACQGVDVICHCAAQTRAVGKEPFFRINTHGTILLARTCLEVNGGLRRFLYMSSHAAVGPSQTADDYVDELTEPRPITWYGKSKWEAEQAVSGLAGHLPLTVIRPAAVFGPRDRDFVTYFAWVKRGLRLKLGRVERQINLVYIHDLVDLVVRALEDDRAAGQTYFASGSVSSYTGLAALIAKVLDRRTLLITLPEAILAPIGLWSRALGRITGLAPLLNDQRILDMKQQFWLCSGEKARRELGFLCRSDLEPAVKETADWYQREGWI